MSCDVDTCLTRSTARRRRPLTSSRLIELSRPNLVEACDIGVVGGDDMTKHLLCANASDWENPVLSPGMDGFRAKTRPYEAARSGTFLPHQESREALSGPHLLATEFKPAKAGTLHTNLTLPYFLLEPTSPTNMATPLVTLLKRTPALRGLVQLNNLPVHIS